MQLQPDDNNDWINQRDPNYRIYPQISGEASSPFISNAVGVNTARDIWVSGFSKSEVLDKSQHLVDNYNIEVSKNGGQGQKSTMRDSTKIKWTRALENKFKKGEKITYNSGNICLEMYRPFTKKWLMYDKNIVEMPGKYLTRWGKENIVIVTTGRAISKKFSVLISKYIPNFDLMEKGQGFMEFNNEISNELISVKDNMNSVFSSKVNLSKDDTFAYVYGLLSSKEYQAKYQNDLKKDLARIPIVKNKEKYVEIGKKLMELHLNYEEVPAYEKVNIKYQGTPDYKVKKMKFAKKRSSEGKLEKDKSTIIFNDSITIENIPEKAYQYIVNGRSAIEWIMDQYQVKTDKKSGITDDPNDFSDDPKYIFNLLLSIINVSVQTVDLINQLPKLEIEE